ncbi:MAG: hypothetical protein ACI8UO_006237 [Verrucomicrobiales bacterium]
MKLDDISAEIRPRSNFEAVDLGWALNRVNFWRVTLAWMVTVWPIQALIIALCWEKPMLAIALIWAFKPLYERVPLFVLSRALFGAPPTAWQTFKSWPVLFFRNFFGGLFLGHFSPFRSLTAPVTVLEGLSGSKFRRRASGISTRAGGAAWWTQIGATFMVHLTWISVLMIIWFLVPEGILPSFESGFQETWVRSDEFFSGLFYGEFVTIEPSLIWTMIGAWLFALTVVQPIYSASGFGLYLNARSHLEGWDIELTFRRMGLRLSKLASGVTMIVVSVLIFFGSGQQLLAQDGEGQSPRSTIDEVLENPDFEIHKETRYYYQDSKSKVRPDYNSGSSSSSSNGPVWGGGSGALGGGSVFAGAGTATWVIVIIAIVIGIGFLIWMVAKKWEDEPAEEEKKEVRTVMGMNVTRESLPPDIISAARKLWAEGNYQEAIGLLYRGAISGLIEVGTPIEESDTEVEVVRRSRRIKDAAGVAEYFGKLTGVWVCTAYGKTPPRDPEMNELCGSWPFKLRPNG